MTWTRWKRLFEAEAGRGVLLLDDPMVAALERERDDVAALLEAERARLRSLEQHERATRKKGFEIVAGVDEVGRGPLAGPLVAAAVIFDDQPWIPMLDDSKKLAEELREALHALVIERAMSVGVGVIEVEELNTCNLHEASLEAMRRAISQLAPQPSLVLVDGCHAVPGLSCAQQTIIKGDASSVSIAAASVVAKVIRDRRMAELDERCRGYGFAVNKGYGTPDHLEALARLGPCEAHRVRFGPVARALEQQLPLF